MIDSQRSAIARLAASAPPRLKSPLFCRAIGKLTRGQRGEVETNLGIDQGLAWRVPIARPDLAFGRPLDNLGERGALLAVKAFAESGRVFVDVGANWGLYTAWTGAAFDHVIAVEPEPRLAARLEANIAANRLNARVLQVAISDASGQATFYVNRDDDAMGSLLPVYGEQHQLQPIAVPVTTLAQVLDSIDAERAVVKIAVEGHGGAAWRGLRAAQQRVEAFVLEVTGPEAAQQVPRAIIANGGWHAYYIVDCELRYSRSGEFNYVSPFWNWLFTRLDPAALSARLAATPLRVTG